MRMACLQLAARALTAAQVVIRTKFGATEGNLEGT